MRYFLRWLFVWLVFWLLSAAGGWFTLVGMVHLYIANMVREHPELMTLFAIRGGLAMLTGTMLWLYLTLEFVTGEVSRKATTFAKEGSHVDSRSQGGTGSDCSDE